MAGATSLDYAFDRERECSYGRRTKRQIIEHFSRFIATVWRIHPFREGNTRTTAVFAIKYLKELGFKVAFFRGVAYSHEDEKQCGENVVLVMRGNNIKCGHIVDDSDRVFIDKAIVGQDQLMTKFSVLFAMSSGSKEHVGKTAVYYDYPAMAAYGAFCSKYVPSDSYRYFMFNFLSSSTYRAFVKRICGGTGINNMKEEYFNVPLFALPGDIGQVRKFNELTATIYAQVYNCTQEMSKLMSLRDFLLPLLMNGQVKVA